MGTLRIEGAIDLHCHYGPDMVGVFEGTTHAVTAIEAAREAARCGQAALVLKAHDFATPALAHALAEVVPEIRVFGGITLDHQAGGLNPAAVESALRLGAKIVWLPTLGSVQDYRSGLARDLGYPAPGIAVLDENAKLVPAAREIARLVREFDAVLASGHTTADEHYAVVQEFARAGRVLVTHAGARSAGPGLSPVQCRELAQLGATIELTALCCTPVLGNAPDKTLPEMLAMIETIGAERCTLASDYGWSDALPRPAAGLRDFFDALWAQGVPESQLIRMARDNPARLLGLAG
jgi:Family of unknown function (DUF6282)